MAGFLINHRDVGLKGEFYGEGSSSFVDKFREGIMYVKKQV